MSVIQPTLFEGVRASLPESIELTAQSLTLSSAAPDVTLVGPCGHLVDFMESAMRVDDFVCPACDMWWGIEQEPPTVFPSGFVMPGKRRVVVRGTRSDRISEQIVEAQKFHKQNDQSDRMAGETGGIQK